MTGTNPFATERDGDRLTGSDTLIDEGFGRDLNTRDGVIEVAEEFATVDVERRETGVVRVHLKTDETDELLPVSLRHEGVTVTRHPVEQELTEVPQTRTEGDVTIIPVYEERAVVVTKLFLVEEIHIRREIREEQIDAPVTLRRQRAVVERLDENGVARDDIA
ncbi:MAG: hypothetical protein DI498_09730 [Paracoccus denitrificans]|nr:MAG: hypothetical protein DI498_09730 [Paracoccus denitrificans]PZO83983.1 MAG: hypothetical protein DI633_09730 [Paracoccus denitrificans]